MLIGIDASRANIKHKSGTEWYAYYLIRWLAKLDDKNEYILYTNEPLTNGLLDLRTEQYHESEDDIQHDSRGFQKIKSPYNNFKAKVLKWPFDNFWTLGRLSLEMLSKSPDLLFIPSHTLPIFRPRHTLLTIHDYGFASQPELYKKESIGPKGKLGKFAKFLVRAFTLGKYHANTVDYLHWSTEHALKNAEELIFVSESLKKDIISINKKIDQNRLNVIYNGYNAKIYKRCEDKNKIDKVLFKYGVEGPYFFYVGRLDKKKNISALIEAYAILKQGNPALKQKLVLAGDAFYGYDEINYMIEEFDLDNDVIMPGWIEEIDMPYFYSKADAFVFPSLYEGFGITVLQAMACGVPVLISDIPALREVAGDAALYFDPNLRFKMAEALEEFIKNDGLRNDLVKKGYERIKDFSWEKTSRQTLDVINKMLK